MNEPSDHARDVLARYRDDVGPSSAERAALVLGLQRAIASGVGPSTIGSAAAVGRRTPWLVIVGVTAMVVGGVWWATRPPQAVTPVAAIEPAVAAPEEEIVAVVARRSVAPATLPLAGAPPVVPTATPLAPVAAPPIASDRGVRRLSRSAPTTIPETTTIEPAPDVATVDAEVALLREASVAFKRGDTAVARARYDEHVRRFPDGALIELREVGLALLDCRADPSTAAGRAQRFATRFPGSPHLVRIERECTP